ncbi:mitochondrial basic amino acids transporter-like [Zootermopsis nevadensis]|uniref:Mitochondrial basic amino acids transporter n=1 Tax=Zootermopsis nevadensis TaxID=136037 RepID=A0A067QIB6_ZOONE|nr:mitochondrial basic amino acids transporter-like [Zootermopsis nevadensis]XP_021939645.1 mitochondrial basic amino acids transporter-like [Zootermopsis nevadensis]XP_021939646.1 mitochondrial basic amino acids transporter-like [Zootermopsis nevadensis]XP_021939647.1 mitochondrial basic amino acids transporter-like [Zootermopsis nevadensis]XP_021939649.1 mitochondrial basic amino acids transporter-like [Zootermopsis nevadensis]XP_021939650.1 mitochondrial basic amino acids transporter-like [
MALDFFAGCLGGCAGIMMGHPFDTIKVRLQTQNFRNPQYKGAVDCLTSILKKESIWGLYKGMSSPMAGVAVVNAVVFGVYGNFQRHVTHPEALSSHFVAGAVAGFVQSFVCSPMELVKTRLQIQDIRAVPGGGYTGPMNCLVQVAKAEGLRGVFRGLGATICREVPGFGTYFFAYELMTRPAGPPLSTSHMMFAGGLSGTLSWVITYPIDVVKSRLQVDGMGGVYRYTGFVDCLRKSIQTEGYRVLTRGLGSTVLRAFPTNAATFTVVTWVIRWADENHVETTSGYVIAELVDFKEIKPSKVQNVINHDEVHGFKVFGVLENIDFKDKCMKTVFELKKTILHNFIGSNIFPSQQLMLKSRQICSSGKGDDSERYFCENVKEDICMKTALFQESKTDTMNKAEEDRINKSEDSEDGENSDRQRDKDSQTEKATNTYEHKNDYYNSSVR